MASALPCPSFGESDPGSDDVPTLGIGRLTLVGAAAAVPGEPASPAQLQKVVSLYAEHGAFNDDPDAPAPDWPSAFQLIRDVGAQVRLERDRAQAMMQQSQSLIRGVIAQAENAELRAEAAEAAAFDALQRADRAEARARLAEEQAQDARKQALAAQAGQKEAELWLRRLHANLKNEYDGLAIAPE